MSNFLIKSSVPVIRKPIAREHKCFVIIFMLTILFGLTTTHFVNATYLKNYNVGAGNVDETIGSVKGAYINILSESDKSADILLFEGISLINKNQTETALLALEEAVKRDPNYRDAALFTGYTYLRLAQEIPPTPKGFGAPTASVGENANDQSNNYLLKAKFYLEKARDIDPLYAKTHQYLAIVYQELGDTQNAELSTQRAQDFAK